MSNLQTADTRVENRAEAHDRVLCTKSRLAEVYGGKSTRTIDRWVKRGLIPGPIKIGISDAFDIREHLEHIARLKAARDAKAA